MRIDLKQLEFIHPTLRDLTLGLEESTGQEFTITSLYRIGGTGVHSVLPLRGIDLRCRDKELGQKLEKTINSLWIYDPSRLSMNCALLHGEGSNMHLHLQVSDATRKR